MIFSEAKSSTEPSFIFLKKIMLSFTYNWSSVEVAHKIYMDNIKRIGKDIEKLR
ncbi:hypothetical protein RhiirA5_424727 [Rhizophagus irregularis]|uniref:Uncharacterized protein n=1 Tax=Rhizophagus irregularis TaxID=588596 RepID=A0A2N0P7G9_9GLOM|nr:hypothetical protein RhiirA5_424727 [Rhizophagus irregularis]